MLAFLHATAPFFRPGPLAQAVGNLSDAELALMISGGALLYAVIRWRRNTVIKKNATAASPASFPMRSALNMREINEEVQALLADLEETCRRLTAQLDNRTVRIEQLLAEADEKIKALQALAGNGGRPAENHVRAGATEAAVSDAQRSLSRLRRERGAPEPADDPAYQPIYSLADGGKSSREIAQQLGRQPGEIELILALRQRAG